MKFTTARSNLLIMILDPVHCPFAQLQLCSLRSCSHHIAHLRLANRMEPVTLSPCTSSEYLVHPSNECCSVFFPAERNG